MTPPSGIAVIIPVFNAGAFITDALESVRSQVVPASEVVVVDDGSTDGSADAARAMTRDWPQLRVLQQANAGVSNARNRGVASTSSPLIAFLDHDDRMVPTRLARQRAVFEEQPSTQVVIGDWQNELEPGADEPPFHILWPAATRQRAIMTMMLRRTTWNRIGGFDERIQGHEDLDWASRAIASGTTIDYLDEVLVHRRLHGGNASQPITVEMHRAHVFSVLRARLADARTNGGNPT
jgi:glycosyltransferase involved in cell wall biosynthesis